MNRNSRRLAVAALFLALLAAGCTGRGVSRIGQVHGQAEEGVPHGALFVLEDGHPATLAADAVAAGMAGAWYVLVGEAHTTPCDHVVQARLMEALAASQLAAGLPVPAVGLEMVAAENQPALDRFNAGEIGLDELAEALDWENTWGHDFDLYRPVFLAALERGLPLHGLNVPRELVDRVSDQGLEALSPEDRARLPERILPPPEAQTEELMGIFRHHAKMMSNATRAENATMAGGGAEPEPASEGVKAGGASSAGASGDESAAAQAGQPADAAEVGAADAQPVFPEDFGHQAEGAVAPVAGMTEAPPAGEDEPGAEGKANAAGPAEPSAAERAFARFQLVQSLWDTAMAENAVAVRVRTGRPVIVLSGSGHVDNGWGVAHRLATLEIGRAHV